MTTEGMLGMTSRRCASANGVRGVVDDPGDACFMRAVRAAIERAAGLDAVADDHARAVLAPRRQLVNGALEAVEGVTPAGDDDLKAPLVFVAADLAFRHGCL